MLWSRDSALSRHEYGWQKRGHDAVVPVFSLSSFTAEKWQQRVPGRSGTHLAFCPVQNPAPGSRCYEGAVLWAHQPSALQTLFIKRRYEGSRYFYKTPDRGIATPLQRPTR